MESLIERISEEKFISTYNKYPPNKWVKFGFKFFSESTLIKDFWLRRLLQAILLISFFSGLFATILRLNYYIILVIIIPLLITLLGISILMSGTAIMNNLRLRKIRKELGISKKEYIFLSNLYLDL